MISAHQPTSIPMQARRFVPGPGPSLSNIRRRMLPVVGIIALAAAGAGRIGAEPPKRWTDDELVASYRELAAAGTLDDAVRMPSLPKDAAHASFLEALAWYAAGTPRRPGTLTLAQLDARIHAETRGYIRLLERKVEQGEENDYPRTRTWKLIQKYTLLRDEMAKPERSGGYPYPRAPRAAGGAGSDAWEEEHTLRSQEEVAAKVCRPSFEKPVLVKYGNTNCTQCMLFEIIGSIRAFADNAAHKGRLDVYKIWFGYRPDESFAGKLRDPERLDALVKAEGVKSSPTFVVYRNGRRYTCGDAFPDDTGRDQRLEACLRQTFGAEAPVASFCATVSTKTTSTASGR